MEPRNPTLDELFEGIKEYRVPLYQRLYVWNEYAQWAPLWEDIIKIADDLINRDAREIQPHFFGAIVLKKSEGPTPDDANVYRVIDGQQRLTTTQLLIAAAVDEMKAKGTDSRTIARLSDLIENPGFAERERRFKMRHGGNNYKKFRKVVGAKGDLAVIRSLTGEMSECYLFFRREMSSWLGGDTNGNRASALATTLRTKMQVVAIYLEPNEPEHLIFETLNARGSPLTEWDKIRNYLFYRVQRDQDDFFLRYLKRFDKTWWRESSGRGQDTRPRTDRFVDYWLESRLQEPVSRARVFRDFKEHTEDQSEDDLLTDVESLVDDAKYYRAFEKGAEDGEGVESVFHHRRRQMDMGSFWPLILGIRHLALDDRQRDLVLLTIESWAVRRWLCGYQARNYPDRALDLLKRMTSSDGVADVAARIMVRLSSITEISGWWPDDEEVSSVIPSRRLSMQKSRFALEAIERHITSRHAALQGVRYGDLQVEHLMPRKWKPRHWPVADDREASDRRNRLVRTLGNLTLLMGSLNAKLSNGPWSKKREGIGKSDNLYLNKDLLERASDTWDEDNIQKRGQWMAEQVCEIWPHAEVLRQRLGEP